jgi:hypothetical protein
MRTLTQIEPRHPIESLPFTVTAPGSYYLTACLTGNAGQDGIIVEANDVTIDLGGFALQGGGGGDSAVVVGGERTGLCVRNGTIIDWAGYGIEAPQAREFRVEHLRVARNGTGGMLLGRAGVVSDCVLDANTGEGLGVNGGGTLIKDSSSSGNTEGFALRGPGNTITGCNASNNTGSGIHVFGPGGFVNRCNSTNNGQHGIETESGIRILESTAQMNTLHGIKTGACCLVDRCIANGNGQDGIHLDAVDCVARENLANGNGAVGIWAGGGARLEANTVAQNQVGITCHQNGNNLVVRNNARANNAMNYNIAAGNNDAAVAVNPGPAFGLGNAWANFTH